MNRKLVQKSLVPGALALAVSSAVFADITLYDSESTTMSADASFNTFYVYSDSDNEILGTNRKQSRVKMGFLPNWLGFNFSQTHGDLKLGGRASFWVTINDSDNAVTSTGIDVRQFYGTVDGDWGQILIGKDFTLFNRSNIFQDEILLGYGQVSDTLGLVDGSGVSFGNIGSGYTYPMPSSQITYRSPEFAGGFKLALGLIDPSRTTEDGEESAPRIEGELTFSHKAENGSFTAWAGFLTQTSESDTSEDIDSQGVSLGVKASLGNFSAHLSGFDASGVGFLLGPGVDHTLGLPLIENGDEVDSKGYLAQASYTKGVFRFVASFGENELETTSEWSNETTTGGVFYDVTDNLKLVAEYNINDLEIGSATEETKTLALGLIINF